MQLIFLIVVIVGILIFFKVASLPIFAIIVAIVMGSITLIVLISVWLGTLYSLRKRGHHNNQAGATYNQLKSDLQRICTDLEEIRAQIADLTIMNHDRVNRI